MTVAAERKRQEVELEGRTSLGIRVDARYRKLGSGQHEYWQLAETRIWIDGRHSGWHRHTARRRKPVGPWPASVWSDDAIWNQLNEAAEA